MEAMAKKREPTKTTEPTEKAAATTNMRASNAFARKVNMAAASHGLTASEFLDEFLMAPLDAELKRIAHRIIGTKPPAE